MAPGSSKGPTGDDPNIRHASCVALNARGCLITGASASGKSSLALSLMGYGASLISDDRVVLTRVGDEVFGSAPAPIQGLIEARGVGILTCDAAEPVAIKVVVDMNRTETARLPECHSTDLLGVAMPLLYRVDGPHFAPALIQYLKSGRRHP